MIAVFLKKHSKALLALSLLCCSLSIYLSINCLAVTQKSQSQAMVGKKQIPAAKYAEQSAGTQEAAGARVAKASPGSKKFKETMAAESRTAASHLSRPYNGQNTDQSGAYRTHSFVIYDEDSGRITRRLKANLKASGAHADIWVDSKETISDRAANEMVKEFDERIYPTDIRNFANKKCQSNVKRAAFLVTDIGNSDGYFDSRDIDSMNKMNLIYLNADLIRTEPSETYSTLAHEFEHLLFYMSTRNDQSGTELEWLDEGLAVYAEKLNGNFPSYFVDDFRRDPRVKLDGEFSGSNNSYGAAFLFISFAADQVKASNQPVPDFLKDLIYNSGKGMHGLNLTLHRHIANKSLDSYSEIYKLGQLKRYSVSIER
jgi:hypothetical protein